MIDKQLVSLLKKGDHDTLKNIYLDYKKEFFKFSNRYDISQDKLEDIYQDAILVLYERALAGKLDNLKYAVKTYLFSIGKFMIFKSYNKSKKTFLTNENYVFDQLDYNLVETVYNDKNDDDQHIILIKNFKKLGKKCKEVLELFYQEGLKIDEIKVKLGYENKNVVKSQKSRCLKSLKELIRKENG